MGRTADLSRRGGVFENNNTVLDLIVQQGREGEERRGRLGFVPGGGGGGGGGEEL